ncbi:MAG: alpha/beta hydrolase [Proteobacteria bacterium]|nr:alpha/beta hydrolase [Pseudomonadota bacterium]
MQEIFLDSPRGRIAALRAGDPQGAPLLAMHGWLDNAASFIPLHPYLSGFDLVALDMPGHGASAHRATGYDYTFVDWVHDALDALDALGWPRARLLGHSMGAAIATMVAAAAPERVERLVLIEALGPVAGAAETAGSRLRAAVTARRTAAQRPRKTIASIDTAVKSRLAVGDMRADAARLIVERNLRAVEGGWRWRSDPRLALPSHLRITEEAALSIVAAVEAPTLLIAADPSPPYFLQAMRDARVARLRDGRLRVLPGGHHLHMEQPEIVGPIVRDFLREGAP